MLALDSGNDLFVASSGTAGVLVYPWNAASGSYPSSGEAVPGATQLSTLKVAAMALDAKNDLFVATSTQVLEFLYNASAGTYAASGTVIATVAAGGLALDTSGDLFVSNPSTSQVQEYLFNSATGAYAPTGITVAGTGGNGSGTNQLSGPTALGVDHSGDLLVFDAGNARVMEFTGNQATGAYTANGTAVFTGARDNYPETGGLALDSRGDAFYTYNYSSAGVYESVASDSSGLPFPWADADVGSPALAGSASYASGVFTVKGGGVDIWAGSDQFNYVSQPLTGNASIVARVTSQSDTDPWAKAGVMIKQSTASGSSYALLGVTPGNGITFQSDFNASTLGGSYSFPNAWLKLTRSGSTITAFSSADGSTWTAVGAATISLTDPVTIGLFTTSHNAGALGTATFDNVSVTAGGSSALPSPWADADVGSPAVAGSASYASGVFTVNGSGADIWGTSDQFNYVSQSLTGDGSIVARVTSQSDTDPWAKAGVMIKQSTTSGSPYALLAVTPGNGVQFEYGYNASVGGESYTFPNAWLKLTRTGSTITAFSSADGSTWTPVGATTISLTDPVTIGLFTTAHNAGALSTATFDNVSVTGSSPVPSPWADADVGSPAVAGAASYASGVFTVNGGGADIWGGTDQFNYVSQPLTGNASIVARVTSQSDTDPWAKAGVMIKQSTASGSSYALLARDAGQRHRLPVRLQRQRVGRELQLPQRLAQADPVRVHHYRLLLGRRHHLDPGRDDHDLVDRSGHDRPVHLRPQRRRTRHGHFRQRNRHLSVTVSGY